MTLVEPAKRARSVVSSQWPSAAILCGTVTTIPSTFRVARAAAMKPSRSAGATCAGTTSALAPRSTRMPVSAGGDFTCAIGSPTM